MVTTLYIMSLITFTLGLFSQLCNMLNPGLQRGPVQAAAQQYRMTSSSARAVALKS